MTRSSPRAFTMSAQIFSFGFFYSKTRLYGTDFAHIFLLWNFSEKSICMILAIWQGVLHSFSKESVSVSTLTVCSFKTVSVKLPMQVLYEGILAPDDGVSRLYSDGRHTTEFIQEIYRQTKTKTQTQLLGEV